jgi:hypothetical protein
MRASTPDIPNEGVNNPMPTRDEEARSPNVVDQGSTRIVNLRSTTQVAEVNERQKEATPPTHVEDVVHTSGPLSP